MQQVANWPTSFGVVAPSARVTVGGVEREAARVSVSASVDSQGARTGDVEWDVLAAPAGTRQSHTLHTTVPHRGDRVSVEAGQDGVRVPLLTGKIESTSTTVPGGLSSEIMDDWDTLNTTVDLPALCETMPPQQDEGPLRKIGLTATYPTQIALAAAGFQSVPRVRNGAIFGATLNGSLWPEFGQLLTSPTMPTWSSEAWGDGAQGYTATYSVGSRSFGNGALEVEFLVGQAVSTSRSSSIVINFPSSGDAIRIVVWPGRAVGAYFVAGGSQTTACVLSNSEMSGSLWVKVRVTAAGAWSITNDQGQSVSGTASISDTHKVNPSNVVIAASGVAIAGVTVGFYTSPIPTWRPSAVLDASDGTLDATRALVGVSVKDLLRERADAEQAVMWIDEKGVFQWRNRGSFRTGNPVKKITGVDLLGYSLGQDFDSIYSKVRVKTLDAEIQVRGLATLMLHQGSSQSLNAGDVQTDIITPPDNEDWPHIDSGMDVLGSTGDVAGFNRGRRTWSGAVRVSADGKSDFWAYGSPGNYVSIKFEKINLKTWKHTLTVGTGLAKDQSVETRAPNTEKGETVVWTQWSAAPLPMIRGYAKTVWVDRAVTATAAGGRLSEYEHDCSWWVQGDAVGRLASWLADRYKTPVITMTGINIIPDARLQLGDIVTIEDRVYAGLSVKAVVTGLSHSLSYGSHDMSLDVEVLSVSATDKTYADVQATATPRTYAQYEALVGAVTYKAEEAL